VPREYALGSSWRLHFSAGSKTAQQNDPELDARSPLLSRFLFITTCRSLELADVREPLKTTLSSAKAIKGRSVQSIPSSSPNLTSLTKFIDWLVRLPVCLNGWMGW
jgi:hypothetical protein